MLLGFLYEIHPDSKPANSRSIPAEPLIAIWGMETGFGAFMGNQNTLSAITTFAYDCRRSEYFTEQLYATLKLLDLAFSTPSPVAPCTARSVKLNFYPRASCSMPCDRQRS